MDADLRAARVASDLVGPVPRRTFFLGTHMPGWLSKFSFPMFVSRRRLAKLKTLPRALGPWALDSGGFTELSMFGRWTVPIWHYVEEVRRYRDEIGGMLWAAPQDWMCEPPILAKTGYRVEEHQGLTVWNVAELRERAPEIPWIPVLQGWEPDDYLRHVDRYARAGIDLTHEPVVGVGSVCRRQATAEAAEQIVGRLSRLGINLHGFGFKSKGLIQAAGNLRSADSLAWSFRARKIRKPALAMCVQENTHVSCSNCPRFAQYWREDLLNRLPPDWSTS